MIFYYVINQHKGMGGYQFCRGALLAPLAPQGFKQGGLRHWLIQTSLKIIRNHYKCLKQSKRSMLIDLDNQIIKHILEINSQQLSMSASSALSLTFSPLLLTDA